MREPEGKESGQRMSHAILTAVSHPIRREMLRLLHAENRAMCATEMSRILRADGDKMTYHLKVLRSMGAVSMVRKEPARGATAKYYASLVTDHRRIVSILRDTEPEDAGMRRVS